ncbi:hypothetical protein SLEP1_g33931 [Rubroshorea leprosula]|uniref:Reverse transcriptase/retrotransposon-derived protein RNase H-like domain-containing protein n=1 Tax=Rubroshorea leprosula TaxID=152421 RepID=A0AAV5KIA7_9ROSI|nr:hypothetical protein SLEP1_g33931 [Rubroshorea leprosula]
MVNTRSVRAGNSSQPLGRGQVPSNLPPHLPPPIPNMSPPVDHAEGGDENQPHNSVHNSASTANQDVVTAQLAAMQQQFGVFQLVFAQLLARNNPGQSHIAPAQQPLPDDVTRRLDNLEKLVAEQRCPTSTPADSIPHPLNTNITLEPYPASFKIPQLETYDGTKDPDDHLYAFYSCMQAQNTSNALMCKIFPSTLRGNAQTWYYNLPLRSISSYIEMASAFAIKFSSRRLIKKTTSKLMQVKQRDGESLKNYMSRFNDAVLEVSSFDQAVGIAAVILGLNHERFRDSLLKHPATTFSEVNDRSLKFITVEEWVVTPHNDPLVILVMINNCQVQRVLVDTSSAPDIMYYHCFESLGLDPALPQCYNGPIYGLNNQPVPVEGVLTMNVAFGSNQTYVTPSVRFLVVKMPSSFNVVIGQPTLIEIRAVVSQANLCMKFPTPMGIATLRREDVEKACPKDCYPMPNINKLVEAASGNERLSLLDAYSSYHQVPMALEDEEKTSFYAEDEIYCYVMMPFGLKNAAEDHLTDLEETFNNHRKNRMRLNPAKCIFGVESEKFLGFMVSRRGIEVNPEKVKAVAEMEPPESVKDIMRLAAQKDESSKQKKFEWNLECQAAFDELKSYCSSPPLLTKANDGEILYLYLGISDEAISSVLVREAGKQQKPVYYTSSVLHRAKIRYSIAKEAALAVVTSTRKLRPYFQSHPIIVLMDQPLKQILQKPECSRRLIKWAVELGQFEITFQQMSAIQAQALADFIVECTSAHSDSQPELDI